MNQSVACHCPRGELAGVLCLKSGVLGARAAMRQLKPLNKRRMQHFGRKGCGV